VSETFKGGRTHIGIVGTNVDRVEGVSRGCCCRMYTLANHFIQQWM